MSAPPRSPILKAMAALLFAAAVTPAQPAWAQHTLLVLGESVPASLDYDGPSGNHPASQTGFHNLIEPLVEYAYGGKTEDGTQLLDFNKFQGALAESWSFDSATLTWTFKLRQGVKSCAGNTFTADDVLYTYARAKSISGKAPIGYFLASVASVANFTPALFAKTPEAAELRKLGDEVKKIDDYTVQIRQSAPNKLLLPVLTIFGALIYDSKEMKAHATDEDPWSHDYANNVNAPSFGPYCLENWTKDEEFVAKGNPNYYRGKPYFDRVIYRKVPQSANRLAILRTGQAQIVESLNPREIESLRTAPNIKIGGGYLNATMFVLLNFKSKPFDNPLVRKAIAFAIPYQDIIRTSYFGQAKQWEGLIPSAYPGYIKPKSQYFYDPGKAKQLLAEAGYPDGKGLEAFPDSFKLSYNAERESILGPTATLMQTRLKTLGIPVELDPQPATQLADRQLVKKDLPFSLYDNSKPVGVDPAYAMQLYFVTPPRGVNNMTNFSDAKLDELFAKAQTEADDTKRNQYLAEAQEILMDKLPLVPVVENKLQFAMQSKLQGLVLYPHQNLIWRHLHE
jgi:peptide/nickel transport system substrate-binding protein